MKYLQYITIMIAAGALIYFAVFGFKKIQPGTGEPAQGSPNVTRGQWETKIDDQPPVSIQITPVELGSMASQWRFDITLTTHSGSLDQDLTKAVSLTDNKGNMYSPIAWEGPSPGGHHLQGILVFKAINPTPLYVVLKVKNVGQVPERLFKWNLE